MRVLITGAAGCVGRELERGLAAELELRLPWRPNPLLARTPRHYALPGPAAHQRSERHLLRQHILDHFAMHIRQAAVDAVVVEREFSMIHA
jgi:nucleoside-diphosphate-sugar epimerase